MGDVIHLPHAHQKRKKSEYEKYNDQHQRNRHEHRPKIQTSENLHILKPEVLSDLERAGNNPNFALILFCGAGVKNLRENKNDQYLQYVNKSHKKLKTVLPGLLDRANQA